MKKRVVVTGIGTITSIGIGKDDFWKNLISGKSGISEIDTFDISKFSIRKGGEIKDFNPIRFITKKSIKSMGRGSQLVIAATKLALEDARLSVTKITPKKIGVLIGTTMGEAPTIEVIDRIWTEKGEDEVYATTVVKFPVNALTNNICHYFGIKGLNQVIPTACAAGNYSLGYAFDLIQTGKKDVVLAGGADPLSRLAFTGFSRLFAMAPNKCQPFDKNRQGMMVGEGSAVLVVEELEHALRRRIPIYAEILGYGLSCDARHMTAPSEDGITKVMERAIKHSGINKGDVDYISAHGTGTIPNDKTECRVIKRVFSERAKDIPVSSIKSMLGHTMGTASALEAITCILAIKNSIIPPTVNYETPDPDCAGIDCVPNVARKKEVNVALNNSYAFGGNNACLVLRKYE